VEILIVSPAVGGLGAARIDIPDHGTAERRTALVRLHQGGRNIGFQIATAGRVIAAGQADEELGTSTGGASNVRLPLVEVEAVVGVPWVIATDGVAARVVVELDP
jgi:hypothetical protein